MQAAGGVLPPLGLPALAGYAAHVVDLFEPVRLPRPAFEELVRQVDAAIENHSMGLILSEDAPYRSLQPLIGASKPEIPGIIDYGQIVDSLDQILLFAFEDAPDDVIERWARGKDEHLVEEAVSRVSFVRNNMPNLEELWTEKSSSIVPPLTGFKYDVLRDEYGTGIAAVVYLAASRVNIAGIPDSHDSTRIRLQLWPSDVQLLIDELEHLKSGHMSQKGGGQDDSNVGAQESAPLE